jgi:hypothetical protein
MLGIHLHRAPGTLKTPGRYVHLDLNAGRGWNANGVGTPLKFLVWTRRQRARFQFLVRFVEQRPDAARELRASIARQFRHAGDPSWGGRVDWQVLAQDNTPVLLAFPDLVREWVPDLGQAWGSIVYDPNGWTKHGGAAGLDALAGVLAQLPGFMLFVHFPYALAKKNTGYAQRHPEHPVPPSLADFLPLRRWWVVREPSHGQINLAGCSSYPPPDSRPWGIHYPDSPEGRAILDHCG